MLLSRFKKPGLVTTLQERGGEVVADARSAAAEAMHHAEDLLELFRLELQEYTERQTRRVVALFLGAGLLLVSYLLLCAAACVQLGQWIAWPLAVAIVFFANFVLGLLCLVFALKVKPGPLAPATRQELKNDLQCLKLAVEQKRKS